MVIIKMNIRTKLYHYNKYMKCDLCMNGRYPNIEEMTVGDWLWLILKFGLPFFGIMSCINIFAMVVKLPFLLMISPILSVIIIVFQFVTWDTNERFWFRFLDKKI